MQQCPQLLFQLEAVFYCDKTLSTTSDNIGTLELELNYHMTKKGQCLFQGNSQVLSEPNHNSARLLEPGEFSHFADEETC